MKTFLLIGTAVLAVAILALGVVGYAFAQTPVPPQPGTPYGGGYGRMMGGRGGGMMGGRGGGMMGGYGATGEEGPMHDFMVAAFAKALNMKVEDLQAELTAGKTMWQVAQAEGLTTEQTQKIMADAQAAALKQMVADGTITQQQADWMLSRMQNRGAGAGPNGECPMQNGGSGGQRGPGGRWNTNPTQPQS